MRNLRVSQHCYTGAGRSLIAGSLETSYSDGALALEQESESQTLYLSCRAQRSVAV